MGYLPSLSSKAAHFVSDLTTVILNPVSERETSHLPVRHRIPAPFPSPPLSCRRFGPVLNWGLARAPDSGGWATRAVASAQVKSGFAAGASYR